MSSLLAVYNTRANGCNPTLFKSPKNRPVRCKQSSLKKNLQSLTLTRHPHCHSPNLLTWSLLTNGISIRHILLLVLVSSLAIFFFDQK